MWQCTAIFLIWPKYDSSCQQAVCLGLMRVWQDVHSHGALGATSIFSHVVSIGSVELGPANAANAESANYEFLWPHQMAAKYHCNPVYG